MEKVQKAIQFLLAKENRIGAVILLIGLFSFVFVSISALNRFSPSRDGIKDGRVIYDQEASVQADNFRNVSPQLIKEIEKKQSTDTEKLKFDRQQNIQESEIQGAWNLNTDKYRYLIQLSKGQYKLVMIPERGVSGSFYYSVGRYTIQNDLLILNPIKYYEQAEKEFPGYRVLTKSKFPVLVSRKGGSLIMQVPGRAAGVYVPPRHPLLRNMTDQVAVFSKLQ